MVVLVHAERGTFGTPPPPGCGGRPPYAGVSAALFSEHGASSDAIINYTELLAAEKSGRNVHQALMMNDAFKLTSKDSGRLADLMPGYSSLTLAYQDLGWQRHPATGHAIAPDAEDLVKKALRGEIKSESAKRSCSQKHGVITATHASKAELSRRPSSACSTLNKSASTGRVGDRTLLPVSAASWTQEKPKSAPSSSKAKRQRPSSASAVVKSAGALVTDMSSSVSSCRRRPVSASAVCRSKLAEACQICASGQVRRVDANDNTLPRVSSPVHIGSAPALLPPPRTSDAKNADTSEIGATKNQRPASAPSKSKFNEAAKRDAAVDLQMQRMIAGRQRKTLVFT